MKSAWQHRARGDLYAPPVEARFIDMFMAALGALVFMSMLLAFLLKYLPDAEPEPVGNTGEVQETLPLRIVSKTLPAAKTDSSFFFPFAYRGGRQPLAWDIVAGEMEIPPGLTFNREAGALEGTPKSSGVYNFVVRVRDAAAAFHEAPFTLHVDPPPARGIERWLAGLWIVILVIVWARGLAQARMMKGFVETLHGLAAIGLRQHIFDMGRGTRLEVHLPEGIGAHEEALRIRRRNNRYLLLILLGSAAYLLWQFAF